MGSLVSLYTLLMYTTILYVFLSNTTAKIFKRLSNVTVCTYSSWMTFTQMLNIRLGTVHTIRDHMLTRTSYIKMRHENTQTKGEKESTTAKIMVVV